VTNEICVVLSTLHEGSTDAMIWWERVRCVDARHGWIVSILYSRPPTEGRY
jgi:hypothetical protein